MSWFGLVWFSDLAALFPERFLTGIFYIFLFLTRCQIAVCVHQLPDAFLDGGPFDQVDITLISTEPGTGNADSLAVMHFGITRAGDAVGTAAPAVFVFQEIDILLGCQFLLKMIVDAVLAALDVAAPAHHIIDCRLGKNKGIILFFCGLVDFGDLLRFGGKNPLIGGKPLIQKDHAIDMVCNIAPAVIDLSLTGHKGASPHVEHIVIGSVAYPLTAFQNLLDKGVVEEPLQIMTALSAVRVVGKERGNFNSMIFQCIACAKQFVLFMVLMEKLHIPCEVSVSTAQL